MSLYKLVKVVMHHMTILNECIYKNTGFNSDKNDIYMEPIFKFFLYKFKFRNSVQRFI